MIANKIEKICNVNSKKYYVVHITNLALKSPALNLDYN